MKAVFIVYQSGLEEDVRTMLREVKAPGYTEWSRGQIPENGDGFRGEKHVCYAL